MSEWPGSAWPASVRVCSWTLSWADRPLAVWSAASWNIRDRASSSRAPWATRRVFAALAVWVPCCCTTWKMSTTIYFNKRNDCAIISMWKMLHWLCRPIAARTDCWCSWRRATDWPPLAAARRASPRPVFADERPGRSERSTKRERERAKNENK